MLVTLFILLLLDQAHVASDKPAVDVPTNMVARAIRAQAVNEMWSGDDLSLEGGARSVRAGSILLGRICRLIYPALVVLST